MGESEGSWGEKQEYERRIGQWSGRQKKREKEVKGIGMVRKRGSLVG